jgi:hypothetical protein
MRRKPQRMKFPAPYMDRGEQAVRRELCDEDMPRARRMQAHEQIGSSG